MTNNQTDNFQLSCLSKKSQQLIQKAHDLLKQLKLDDSKLPSGEKSEKPIRIVFAGQYSAGKSTIVKMLTGRQDIAVGQGISTKEAHSYLWKGHEVTDTPGIHTTLRPQHDEISYQAISQADMLVYVVTYQLFDPFIGEKFRALLNEKHKGKEMILVINKMADVGNTEQMQAIKLEELSRITSPYTPQELRTTFLDAESYVNSKGEPPERAKRMQIRSNYDGFIRTLNRFVQEKNLLLRLTTPLEQTEHELDRAIVQYQPSTGDADFDKLQEAYAQQKHNLYCTKQAISSQVMGLINGCVSQITHIGTDTAEKLNACTDEQDASNILKSAYDKVDELADKLEKDIAETIHREDEKCSQTIADLQNKPWVRSLQDSLDRRTKQQDGVVMNFLKSGRIKEAGEFLIKNSVNQSAAGGGLLVFSGSKAHEVIKQAGHFFGKTFKPWEAVKMAKHINVAGKVFGVFGVVLSIYFLYKEEQKEKEVAEQKRQNRIEIRARFNQAAEMIEKHFQPALTQFLAISYDKPIKGLDAKIKAIKDMRQGKSENCKRLEQLQADCAQLIDEIQQNQLIVPEP